MHTEWLIPDAFLPAAGPHEPHGHEAICVLNTHAEDVHLTLDFYFEDREPIRNVTLTLPAERARHLRTDRPQDLGGAEIPRETPYAVRVRSSSPTTPLPSHKNIDTKESP